MKNGQLFGVIGLVVLLMGYLAFSTYTDYRRDHAPTAEEIASELPKTTTRYWQHPDQIARAHVNESVEPTFSLSNSSNATNDTRSFVRPDFGAVAYSTQQTFTPARDDEERRERRERDEEQTPAPTNTTNPPPTSNNTNTTTTVPPINVTLPPEEPPQPPANETEEPEEEDDDTPIDIIPPIGEEDEDDEQEEEEQEEQEEEQNDDDEERQEDDEDEEEENDESRKDLDEPRGKKKEKHELSITL